MKKTVMLLTILIVAGMCTVARAAESVKVVDVIDGKTILVERGGKEVKVKYDGIAVAQREGMPECSEAAKAANEKLVGGKRVELEIGRRETDADGNILAHVFVKTAPGSLGKDLFVAEELLWNGLAVIAFEPPNLEHAEELEAAQKRARKKGVGLWGDAVCKQVVAEKKVDPDCQFIGHRTSRIYHTADCEHASRITIMNKVCFKSREEAEKSGYHSCTNCGE